MVESVRQISLAAHGGVPTLTRPLVRGVISGGEWRNMVTWKEFTIHSVQTVIFTPDHSAFVGSRVVATIMRQFGDRFSGDMQVLPVPQDVPPEFPAVVLKSGDGSQEVKAGRGRFNCVWKATGPEASVTLREALDRCVPVLQHYVRETNVGVGRLGLVVQRVCPNDNPALTLIRRFCNEESQKEPFDRSSTFEIHNHKEYAPVYEGADFRINSWVRCQCRSVESEPPPVILVTQDLNTLAVDSQERQFDADKIGTFFAMAGEEAESIITKYFPGKNDHANNNG